MDNPIKILFLEDVATDAELNAYELEKAGFAVSSKCVETREAFIRELDEFKPDIILADYSLPSFDGKEALNIVLEKKLLTPFIFVSGVLGEDLAVDAVKCGATDYVLKQNLLRLAPSVRRALREVEEKKKRMEAEETTRKSLHEKEVLLKEIHHRVKNNLQVIISLLNLQASKITDKKLLKLYQDSEYRIRAMALVHEKLYQSENLARINIAEYLKSLFFELYENYAVDQKNIGLEYEADDVELSIIEAVPCGLIINEILSNAFKYAFPPGFPNEKKISLYLQSTGGTIRITIGDNGAGLPADVDFSTTESLGLHLIKILVNQIQGSIALDQHSGTMFTITFSKNSNSTSRGPMARAREEAPDDAPAGNND